MALAGLAVKEFAIQALSDIEHVTFVDASFRWLLSGKLVGQANISKHTTSMRQSQYAHLGHNTIIG